MSLPHSSKTQSPESYVYTSLVESYLGKRAALVVSTLISYGRLTVRELNKSSGLSPILIRKTLVSLIQLGCVSTWEEKTIKSETTYYSFREEGVLLFLYSGDIISHIDQIYNNDTITQIVQNLISLGLLTINEYLSAFGTDDAQVASDIEKFFTTLVNDKYLIPIQKSHFSPIKDVWASTYKSSYSKLPKNINVSELKRVTEAKSIAKLNFLTNLNYEPENLLIKDKVTLSLKVNPNISLVFNFKRFLKARRTLQLTQFCSHKIGKITSIIYEKALLHTEKHSPDVVNPLYEIGLTNEEINNNRTYEPKSLCMFAAKDIVNNLPKDFNLKETVLSAPPKRKNQNGNTQTTNKRVKLEGGYTRPLHDLENNDDDDDDDDYDNTNDSNLSLVDQHLRILVGSTVPFLERGTSGLYYVPFSELITHLKHNVHDYVLSSTLGAPAARILRCVRDNRLVSEKLINSVALLKEKEARSLTSTLVRFNFLQIQEIPKSADRAASKTVFLFRVNEKHGSDFLKNNICWNMGQLLSKISDLRQENAPLIAKINRDDVKGNEIELLLPSELSQLKKMNDKELDLSIKFNRLVSIWEVFKFF